MANRLKIKMLGTRAGVGEFESVFTEDVQVQAISQFNSIGEFVPAMSTLVNLVTSAQATLGGSISKGMLNMQNAINVPLWQKTEPVKIVADMNFFIKTSAQEDVWDPTMFLQSLVILSKKDNNTLIVPGFNLTNLAKAGVEISEKAQKKANEFAKTALADAQNGTESTTTTPLSGEDYTIRGKLFSVYIPGIVLIPVAMMENIAITWSKQLTAEGCPLWSKASVSIIGAAPAVYEDNFLSAEPGKSKLSLPNNMS